MTYPRSEATACNLDLQVEMCTRIIPNRELLVKLTSGGSEAQTLVQLLAVQSDLLLVRHSFAGTFHKVAFYLPDAPRGIALDEWRLGLDRSPLGEHAWTS